MDGNGERSAPGIGDLAKDTATNKVGILMDKVGGRFLLRPVRGGKEWEAEPDKVEFPSASEKLQANNAARNRMRRLGL
ncbi:hypothetical protein [Streptomyces sp. NPDC059575]|uniref:hypothetical protein n=1 Tax=Streptomyces sp. NPDC059575 TaxID=3346872 RepID=UPI0036B56A37